MCGALAALFIGAVLLFPSLFYITSLLSFEWAALGVIAGIALILQPVRALLIKAFFNRKKKKSQ